MYEIHEAPISTDAMAKYPYNPGMESNLTFTTQYGDVVKMAHRLGDKFLLVPRNLAPSVGQDFRISRPIPAIKCKAPPRTEEQAQCIQKSLALLQQGQDHVLEAPTGFGKTYLGSAIAAELGQTTLIIVPKQDLMKSWYDTLIKLVGVDPFDIGIAQADKLDYKGKRFVLAMVQSVIRPGKYDSDFFYYFGLIIFDETHRMAADSFSRACTLFPGKHRLGLSATPKRTDGKTPVVRAHIGPVLVRGETVPMHPKILAESTGWRVPPWITKVDPGKMMGVYKSMAHDAKRNGIITKFVSQAYAKGRNTVVMADTLDHLDKLMISFGAAGIDGANIGYYTGKTQKELLQSNALKRVVLATYGMCSEGTDYPHWDTLVMATPRVNIKQPLGRILRKKEGKRTPVCLDLLDEGSVFKAFYFKRLKQYYEVKAEIVQL